jgi:hypothetical protein
MQNNKFLYGISPEIGLYYPIPYVNFWSINLPEPMGDTFIILGFSYRYNIYNDLQFNSHELGMNLITTFSRDYKLW